MIDLTDNIISLPFDAFRHRIDNMAREEIIPIVQHLESESTRLKSQMDDAALHDNQATFVVKDRCRGHILGKLRVCNARLSALKLEVVTLGIFFRWTDDGQPDFYQKAARLSPDAYREALFTKYGANAPVMINSGKISPDKVPADTWDDLSLDLETAHELFSR